MRQVIPFKKDITFKTKISEITSISLDNDLMLKGEDLISGNFYISGTYKNFNISDEEEYSYKIPCEIAISDDYDTYAAEIDIDDFTYEITSDDVLSVEIVVAINNLERKEEEDIIIPEDIKIEEKLPVLTDEDDEEETEEERCIEDEDEERDKINSLDLSKTKNGNDTYKTYKVYMIKEEDTIESIMTKYKVTKEDLCDYNNLDDFKTGYKLVIPSND